MSEKTVEQPKLVETKKSKIHRLKETILQHKVAILCVAASAVAAGGSAYFGTQKAQKAHAIDVYFKVNDELDAMTPNTEETLENNE